MAWLGQNVWIFGKVFLRSVYLDPFCKIPVQKYSEWKAAISTHLHEISLSKMAVKSTETRRRSQTQHNSIGYSTAIHYCCEGPADVYLGRQALAWIKYYGRPMCAEWPWKIPFETFFQQTNRGSRRSGSGLVEDSQSSHLKNVGWNPWKGRFFRFLIEKNVRITTCSKRWRNSLKWEETGMSWNKKLEDMFYVHGKSLLAGRILIL